MNSRSRVFFVERVRFYSTFDLANALEHEKGQGLAGRIAMSLVRMDLVVLDESGYLPFSQAGGALLFHLLSKLVETVKMALLADARRPRKERRTAKALLQQIAEAGYEGGYTQLTDFIRAWRAQQGGVAVGKAFMPLTFELGEAFQFDWSDEALVIGGTVLASSSLPCVGTSAAPPPGCAGTEPVRNFVCEA